MSSFIFRFKSFIVKQKIKINIVFFILAFFGVCSVITSFLNYIYVMPDDWSNKLWSDFYSEDNIDYLYLGSSHVYCGIDPYILNDVNGKNNFNLSSHSQLLNGSYYLLKEADRKNKLQHVYLEMGYDCSTRVPYSDRMIWNWYNIDYMDMSLNKAEYIIGINDLNNYLETLLPFVRYRSNIFDEGHINTVVTRKRKLNSGNIISRETGEKFLGKGFCIRSWVVQEKELMSDSIELSEEPMLPEAERYLRKIIEYCRNNDIEITLFSVPIYELITLGINDYDNYIEQVSEIADEYGIQYYDFNICKDEILSIQNITYFSDIRHLNDTGAELFTNVFWKIMSAPSVENKKYFYSSYKEKLQNGEPNMYGILRLNYSNNFEVAASRPDDMEYRILLTPDNGGTRMYQEFSSNPYFSVPENEHGICTIVARVTGQEDEVQTLEIDY